MSVKFIVLSMLILFGKNAECQVGKTTGQTSLICKYDFAWRFDTINNVTRDDLIILQVGNEISKSYSYYTFQSDSLSQSENGEEVWDMMFKKAAKAAKGGVPSGFPHKRSRTYVYKNYPKGKITVTDGISLQDYIYEDEINAQNWEVLDSTSIVLDYVCQLAKCSFRGRVWSAWFASEIPVSEGPWKFCGLPGLIMNVFDESKQYEFTILGMEKKEEPIVFTKSCVGSRKFEKTDRMTFLRTNKRYVMNTNGFIEMETGIDLGSNSSGKVMRYDLIERDY